MRLLEETSKKSFETHFYSKSTPTWENFHSYRAIMINWRRGAKKRQSGQEPSAGVGTWELGTNAPSTTALPSSHADLATHLLTSISQGRALDFSENCENREEEQLAFCAHGAEPRTQTLAPGELGAGSRPDPIRASQMTPGKLLTFPG